jgi:hypothetical protein
MLYPHPTIIYEFSKARHEELIQAAHTARLLKQGRKQRRWPRLKLGHLFARLATPKKAINPT